jgi:hypothetical protein
MVKESVDRAVRVLSGGNPNPHTPKGYTQPARTKEELLATQAASQGETAPAASLDKAEAANAELLRHGVTDKYKQMSKDSGLADPLEGKGWLI